MEDAKEEIRARLAVEDVVGQYIELKRAGRNFKGHSPWGTDRTPSFMVSPDKGIWHDFSSNKGGDKNRRSRRAWSLNGTIAMIGSRRSISGGFGIAWS